MAAREAAGFLTYYGRRYPTATAVVLIVALAVGLAWYWQQQQRRLPPRGRRRGNTRSG